MRIVIDPTAAQWDAIDRLQHIAPVYLAIPQDGDNADLSAMITIDTTVYSYVITEDGTLIGQTVSETGDGWVPTGLPENA